MTVTITGGRTPATVSADGSSVTITGSRTAATITESSSGGGVTDHGALTGLSDDDHGIYALADGTRGSFAATGHTHTGTYEAVGVAAALVDDLSGVTNAATARTNLDLGTAATTAATDYAPASASKRLVHLPCWGYTASTGTVFLSASGYVQVTAGSLTWTDHLGVYAYTITVTYLANGSATTAAQVSIGGSNVGASFAMTTGTAATIQTVSATYTPASEGSYAVTITVPSLFARIYNVTLSPA